MSDDRLDPAAVLVSLATSLHRRELPPDAVCEQTVRAIHAWLNGCELATAFQLRPAAASYAERDNALREAGALVDNDAARLAAEIARQERRRTDTPVSLAIARAAATGRKLPRSTRQLRRILEQAA
jgi:hypothetical protein